MNSATTWVLAAALLGFASAASGQTGPAACTGSGYRAFDFWLGEWNVHGGKEQLAGTNSVTREYSGCVVHEHYKTGRGYSGESLNIYDASRKVWHQTWVDSSGTLLVLEGGLKNGKMVLEGQTTTSDGKPVRQRITWTPNAEGSVRQLWESSNAKGKWTVVFDGKYTRQ